MVLFRFNPHIAPKAQRNVHWLIVIVIEISQPGSSLNSRVRDAANAGTGLIWYLFQVSELTEADLQDLWSAITKLEHPGLTARIADLIGKPVQAGFRLLPGDWNERVTEITQTALLKGLELAVFTMNEARPRESSNWLHRIMVAGSGVAGGAAGIGSLLIELPVSTTIILRSIADIARSEGQDICLPETKLSCLSVLAFGGKNSQNDSADEGYWVVRAALAKSISEAAAYIGERGLAEKGAPPLVRLIAAVASRFSTVVTEEVAAKSVPVIGAVAGGVINVLFMYHFQEIARGHFIIKRLEKKYGVEALERAYRQLSGRV